MNTANHYLRRFLPSPDVLDKLMATMLLIRRFEEKVVSEYPRQLMRTPVHLSVGQEAVAAGVCAHLVDSDYLVSNHRNHGHCLAKGVDPFLLYSEYLGKSTGCAKGKGGSMHPVAPEKGILGCSAIVGGGIPIAVGHALAAAMDGKGQVSVVFFGDGATEEGAFHESLNFAQLHKLPVVFVCEHNGYATASPVRARQPHDTVLGRAMGHGISCLHADGNDSVAVYHAAGEAISRARQGFGPTFMECRTYRWHGHVGPDCDYRTGCRPRHELLLWQHNCPIEFLKAKLTEFDLFDEAAFTAMDQVVRGRIDAALHAAMDAPSAEPATTVTNVFRG